ncbi:putative mitochondrial carrier C29A3.11c [Ceratocystis platani]|uniref:Putative mitochondrial carrier C29A3.11c n=1 Tax=Ceratocystis fimbriata f. sp. platani TaxID=88771 RepID=A0A0F8AXE3_CERFI|nr:putative mitochondrial carrier C29A3.11c [Ceratocystis platani]
MLALPIQTLGEQPKEFLRKYHIEVAACTSSVVSTTTAFPLDSIKTRMQTYRYPSVAECARQTYKSENLRGFFRVRDTIGTGVYFMVYESGKQITSSIFGSNPDNNKLSVAVAGGLCGVLSWAVIYPVDSVKSIYQRNSLTSLRGEKVPPAPRVQFFKRNMYRGLGVSITRSAVVNAVFFTFFEGIKKDISKGLSQDEVRKLG